MRVPTFRSIAVLGFLAILAGLVSPSFPANARAVGQAGGSPAGAYVPGQILVQFKPAVSSTRAADILSEQAATRIKRLPALGVDVLQLPAGLSVEKAVQIFSHNPDIAYAEPNAILSIAQTSNSWQDNQWAPQKIQAPEAWAQVSNPAPAVIAVVDTGVDYRHSQLEPNMHVNQAERVGTAGVDDDGNGYIDDIYGWDFANNDPDPLDDHFHGTHVAGIAAATTGSSATSMTGVCPFCQILAVKVLGADGSGALDVVASGITYAADNGANVINMSLGGAAGSTTLQNAVDYAWNKGVVVVAAAGNDGADARLYPAAYANAIAVAATNSQDYRSCFSNYGNYSDPYVNVSAPGESIYSTTPLDANGIDTYGVYSGTSMATPHVSGLAGLLFSQDPGRTNSAVRDLIEGTTNDLGPVSADPFFGTGRINAYRAVTNNRTATQPPDGLFSTSLTASGYAHARKLARDASGVLHLVWHTQDGSGYRVRYATSSDNGTNWVLGPDVYSGSLETYHPALAVDGQYVYVAYPQKSSAASPYQVFFTKKPLVGGSWATPVSLLGGSYDAVRPDLYLDPSNGRLHLVAASLDNAPYVYYRASGDQGANWTAVKNVNPSTSTTASNTRYASVHASGNNVYISARTLANSWLYTYYYLHTVRSTDGGVTWFDQTKISSYQALLSGEYGVSLAGMGDRLYMGYEVGSGNGGGLYFRRYDGAGWNNYELLESNGIWPSITQAADGQAWLLWEDGGSLLLRHYTGSAWETAQTLLASNPFNKGYYPNLKLGANGGRVEWMYTACSGAPFRLVYGSMSNGAPPPTPPTAPTNLAATAKSTSQIALTWTDNASDESGFRIERSPDGSSGWSAVGTAGMNAASYTDTGLDPNTTYFYRVRAYNDGGDSAYSNVANATTLASSSVIDAVANGEMTVAGTRSGDYTWTTSDDGRDETITEIESGGKPAKRTSYLEQKWTFDVQPGNLVTFYANAFAPSSSDGDRFRFEYSTDDTTYTPMFEIAGTTDDGIYQSFVLPGAPSGNVFVRVIDTDRTPGNRTLDTVWIDHLFIRSETSSGATPAAPSGLGAAAISTSQIDLGWTDNSSDEVGFEVRRSPDGGTNWKAIATLGADTTTYSDTGLQPGTSYYYQVLAFNASGYSNPSSPASATTQPASIIHIGNLEGVGAQGRPGRWDATVTVTVHDPDHQVVAGATVSGGWSGGANGGGTCTTDGSGICTIIKTGIKTSTTSVAFSVTDVSLAGWAYDSTANDPPFDTAATITIYAP